MFTIYRTEYEVPNWNCCHRCCTYTPRMITLPSFYHTNKNASFLYFIFLFRRMPTCLPPAPACRTRPRRRTHTAGTSTSPPSRASGGAHTHACIRNARRKHSRYGGDRKPAVLPSVVAVMYSGGTPYRRNATALGNPRVATRGFCQKHSEQYSPYLEILCWYSY